VNTVESQSLVHQAPGKLLASDPLVVAPASGAAINHESVICISSDDGMANDCGVIIVDSRLVELSKMEGEIPPEVRGLSSFDDGGLDPCCSGHSHVTEFHPLLLQLLSLHVNAEGIDLSITALFEVEIERRNTQVHAFEAIGLVVSLERVSAFFGREDEVRSVDDNSLLALEGEIDGTGEGRTETVEVGIVEVFNLVTDEGVV